MRGQIEIYQGPEGTQINVQFEQDTVWLNRQQLAALFDRDVKTIGKHVNNVFKEGELQKDGVVANFATTAADGKTYQVEYYNLDVIISVGYRVKSQQGTHFRIWATQRLKDYLMKGYAINQKRLEQTRQEVRVLKSGMEILSRALDDKAREAGLEWLEHYAKGLELLDDYDHERLDAKGLTERIHQPHPILPLSRMLLTFVNKKDETPNKIRTPGAPWPMARQWSFPEGLLSAARIKLQHFFELV